MKRLMVSLVVMSITFVFGVGIDRLIWQQFESNMFAEDTVHPVPLAVVETKVRDALLDPPPAAQTPSAAPPPIIFNYSSKTYAAEGCLFLDGFQATGLC